MPEDVLDLTQVDVTVRLLQTLLDWRVRGVERLDIDSAAFYRRRRSLQCTSLREVLEEPPDLLPTTDAKPARMVLPIALLPKGPLLDLNIIGPDDVGGQLLVRTSIAERQAAATFAAAEDAGLDVTPSAWQAMVELMAFSEGPWRATARWWRTMSRRQHLFLRDEVPEPALRRTK